MHFIDIAYASEETVATTEHGTTAADEGILASFGINAPLFISQLINFALVASIVWFLILKPLTKKMAERQKMIDDSIANAKKVQDNLTRSEKDYQTKIDVAKAEANRLIEKAANEANVVGDELKVKAKKEIEQLVEQAKKNIKIEKDEMVVKLKEETAEMVILAVEKILGEKMNNEKDKKLIEETLKGIKK